MKKLITSVFILILFVSCEKKYNCTITTEGLENTYKYEFKGTNKEMKEFEQSAGQGQKINCK